MERAVRVCLTQGSSLHTCVVSSDETLCRFGFATISLRYGHKKISKYSTVQKKSLDTKYSEF